MTSAQYQYLAISFYRHARSSAESDERNVSCPQYLLTSSTILNTNLKDHGEKHLTLAHAQCWSLIANFEAQQTEFLRAGLSLGRGIRIAQMLQMHHLDKEDGESTQNSASSRSWIEIEERRRVWWALYVSDRLTSAATGWPVVINDQDVNFVYDFSLCMNTN